MTVVDKLQLQNLLSAGTPVVADFYADWCRPCHVLAPELEMLAATVGDRVTFVKVDVDVEPDLAADLGIMSIPTVIHFSTDGKEVARTVGAARAAQLARNLRLEIES